MLHPVIHWMNTITSTIDRDKLVQVTPELIILLQKWIGENDVYLQGREIQKASIDTTVCTDASSQGYGAHWNSQEISGPWSQKEKKLHLNSLEMMAIHQALVAWANQ